MISCNTLAAAVLLIMLASSVSGRVIPGVQVPYNITPRVDVSDGTWLFDV